jgi:acyl-coenzyme A thioesterase PaaI-like protein
MDVTQLPFNRLIGLQNGAAEDELVSLPGDARYGNHLGTVHAAALLAVAEAGSGEFLQRAMPAVEGIIPVVRRLEAKFRKPAYGRVSARAQVDAEAVERWAAELNTRGRVLASVPVEVIDEQQNVVMSATVEWFLALQR